MKNIFTLFLFAGLLTGLTSCGGGAGSSAAYFVTIDDTTTDGNSCGFSGDGISGNVDFTFDNGKLSILDCWNKIDDGVSALEGQTFKGSVTVGDKTVDGLDITITKVTEKDSNMGSNFDLTGTIAGESKGSFNVSAFKM